MDAQAGDILRQLEEDGLADNTLVFFFSDHGAGLPRAKRWMYDSGLHAPLIVRWPGRLEPGTVSDRLVSFIDFAPTVLAVAGVPIPDHMQGTPFLGDAAGPPRQYVFAARDRMDERYDLIRAVRDARYKYIRNYEPRRPYAQYLSYCESWPVMQEMRRVQAEGGLTDPQKLFFRAVKPVEELYDTEADPNELHNLADSPEHRQHLDRLRAALDQWLADARDIGFIPESELERWLPENPTPAPPKERPAYAPPPDSTAAVFGRALDQWLTDLNSDDSLRRIRAAAALGVAGPAAEPVLRAALRDPEVCVVHWGAAGLANNAPASPETLAALEDALGHSSATARVAAASALCALSRPESAVPVLIEAMAHPHFAIRLRAIETLSALDPKPAEVLQTLNAALEDDHQYVVRIARHGLGLPPKR
jgi:N-sulfoglucosamine sulfohydrolase